MSRVDLLAGIRIVDLSMGWAGPLATRHLADMGAEILKVESCQRADWWRGWETSQAWVDDDMAEKAVPFNTVNRNKLDITLDLTREEGVDLLKRLVAQADAVIENFSGGVLPKLGLDYGVLKAVNPELIMVSMPAFGSTGAWKDYRAYGSTVEQASGLPHLHGRSEDPPVMLHVAYGDPVAGVNGAAALLIALRHKKRTGQGQYIDLSQPQCLFPLGAHGIIEQSVTGEAPARLGNRHASFAPHGVFPCTVGPGTGGQAPGEDQWISIQVFNEAQWQALQRLAAPALDDFGDTADRLANVDALESALSSWTASHNREALMQLLQQEGVPAGAVRGANELVHDRHLQSRQFWQTLGRAFVGPMPHPSVAYREGAAPYPLQAPAPTLGQHNQQILTDLLGLGTSELHQLAEQGVIGEKPIIQG